MLKLEKYSIGVGDRFGLQAEAQLRACIRMVEQGTDVTPVWNKSNREHLIVRSEPANVRSAASSAIARLGWTKPWHVDADHIRLETVGRYLPHSDFFSLDVADFIGRFVPAQDVESFINKHPELIGKLEIPGMDVLQITRADLQNIASRFLFATKEAAFTYRHIVTKRGGDQFITEVALDETDLPQTALELLVILAALADENVPVQAIAPKFVGRFNKGVDYTGDLAQFEKQFNEHLAVVAFAVKKYKLPANLKVSVHSAGDKFSLFGILGKALQRFNTGIHIKTSGTTWLEELAGLAEAKGDGLALAKEIYAEAYEYRDELCAPYAAVTNIDSAQLPQPAVLSKWTSDQFVSALRHDLSCPEFNPHLRQLLHVGFKIAALKGERYLALVREHHNSIAKNVTNNLFEHHLRPLFVEIGSKQPK